MRAVVYGPYTGSPLPGAGATLACVRDLLARGADVVVASPDPSAAHHHLDLGGIRDTVRFARLVAGADVAVLFPSPAVFVPGHRGRRQQAARRLLGLALDRAGQVTVHLPPLARGTDPEFVRLVVGSHAAVVAASESDRATVVAGRVHAGRVSVAGAVPPPAAAGAPGLSGPVGAPGTPSVLAGSRDPWPADLAADRAAVEAEVSRRAAADRAPGIPGRQTPAGESPGRPTPAAPPPVPLATLPPLVAASTYSDRRPVRLVKGLVRKLTAWEVDPVVDHVNVLQRALGRSTGSGPPPS